MISLRKPTILFASVICALVVFGILSSRDENLRAEIQEEANHLLYQWETLERNSRLVHKQNDTGEVPPEPCTVVNPLTNQFFDLRPLGALGNDGLVQAWNARGYDYGRNFSIGICHTPLKQLQSSSESDFEGIANKSEVGGYYTDITGHKKSIGQISTTPKFRGRKLVLEYTDGSVCEGFKSDGSLRKSTILSFVCDREIMTKASISYVGSLHDCSYFFEVRTIHACPTAAKKDDKAIIWIFLFICLCAVAVFFGGGFVYSFFRYNHGRQSTTHWKRNSFAAGARNLAQVSHREEIYK
ncbi:hypothetical protein KL941_005414 [Ogataea angusta]|nr:hypothetical protein KL941_005414 [Ogataea angusta]